MGTVTFRNGVSVGALGLGTWRLAEDASRRITELDAIKTGILAGMTVLDCAEMYASGEAERLLGEAVGQVGKDIPREKLFIVSKVYPHNAGKQHIFNSCERSLHNLGIDSLDLYLLHWRGSIPLSETVECMEELIKRGKIRQWGVSNFDTRDMEELWSVNKGNRCACNQVLYHVASRGIEFDLMPWMESRNMPLMAYCPIAQAGQLKQGLFKNKILLKIARSKKATVAQVLLAFVLSRPNVIAIPRSGSAAHTLENSKARDLLLTADEMDLINREFPKPTVKTPLDIE